MRLFVDRHGVISQRGPHPLGLISRACRIPPRKNNEKFLAAITSDRVVASSRALHAPGEFPENGVAGKMAVGVVDHLEMIEIREHHPDGPIFARAPGKLALENIEDRGA